MSSTINIKPSDEGFGFIASTFLDSVIADVKVARRDASKALLFEALKTVAYLATLDDPQPLQQLLNRFNPEAQS